MRSTRMGLAVLAAVVVAACAGPGGIGGPTLGDVALRQGDVPNGFHHCSYSGAIADYEQHIRRADPSAAQDAEATWAAAQSLGAQSANVTGYAAATGGCNAGIGRYAGPSTAMLVVHARDEHAAAAVYQHGLLGFATPPGQPEQDNLLVGAPTALGQNAWTLELDTPAPGIYVACWQDRDFVALLVAVGVPAQQAHQTAVRVDQRIA